MGKNTTFSEKNHLLCTLFRKERMFLTADFILRHGLHGLHGFISLCLCSRPDRLDDAVLGDFRVIAMAGWLVGIGRIP